MNSTLNNISQEILNAVTLYSPTIFKHLIFLALLGVSFKPVRNFIMKAFHKFLSLKNIDELLVHFLESVLNIGIIVFYILNVIQIIGIEMTSILALLGSIGIGVGLALKGSLSDLAGGIQILLAQPFTKGDFINSCGVEGVVQKITFLYTVLFTTDNKQIVIPNAKLSSDVIVNAGRNLERRVDMVFSVSYDSSIDQVKNILLEMANDHPLVLKEKPIFVRLTKLNASSLDFSVRVWSKKEHYWDIYFDLQEAVKKRFDKEGIEIPYNKLDVYHKQSQ